MHSKGSIAFLAATVCCQGQNRIYSQISYANTTTRVLITLYCV